MPTIIDGTSGVTFPAGGVGNPAGAVVGTTDTQTLTNKTLTSPVISTISNTGTLTLPTSTDTLVGRATTDTLTNKTLTSPTIATPTMTGQATIPTINLTGGQITFPAAQSASSDANTLDDYEEGTWTPTIVGGYTSVSYASQGGWYTKVGRFVNISGRVQFSGTANGAGISVGGLPFSQGNIGNGAYGGGGVPYTNLAVITNTSPYCSGNTVEYVTMGTGSQIVSSGNASSNWISFVITIATS